MGSGAAVGGTDSGRKHVPETNADGRGADGVRSRRRRTHSCVEGESTRRADAIVAGADARAKSGAGDVTSASRCRECTGGKSG